MMYTMYNQMQQNMLSVRVFLNLLGLQEIHGAQSSTIYFPPCQDASTFVPAQFWQGSPRRWRRTELVSQFLDENPMDNPML